MLVQVLTFDDEVCDLAVELGNLLTEQVDHGTDGLCDFGLTCAVAMQLLGFAHIDQLPATTQEIGEANEQVAGSLSGASICASMQALTRSVSAGVPAVLASSRMKQYHY